MWFSASGILVLFLYVNPTISKVSDEATIKDAILSLARVIRDNSLRVDRHQARERVLSENLKRSMEDLTKKVSRVDTFMTHFSKIETQLSKFEQLISQRDERERIQMQRTISSVEKLETSLVERLGKITETIIAISQRAEPDIISRLDDTETHFLEKVTRIESRINSSATKSEGEAAMQAEKLRTLFTKIDEKEKSQNQKIENLIQNFENRLRTQLTEIKDTLTDVSQHVEPTEPTSTPKSISASDIISKLDSSEAHFLEKVARIESRLNRTAIKNDGEAAMQAERLQTLFTKINEKEKSQNQKTENLIENFENRLKTELKEIKDTIIEVSQRIEPTEPTTTTESVSASDIISKLDDTKAHFVEKIAQIESRLNTTALKNDGEAAMQAEKLQALLTKIDEKASTQKQNTENLIENFENRLKTQLEKIKDTVVEVSQRIEATEPTVTPESVSASDIISKLVDTEAHLLENVARIESRLNTTAIENQGEAATQAETLQILITKIDEKEKTQNENSKDLIENFENRLRTQLQEIKDTFTEVSQRVDPTEPTTTTESVSASDIISKLDNTEAHCLEKVAQIEFRLNSAAVKNEGTAATRAERLQTEVQNINGKLENIESLLKIAQEAAQIAEGKVEEPIVDIGAICEEQTRALKNVTKLVEVTLNHIQILPTISEVQLLHNGTQEALQEAKYSLQSGVDDKIIGVIHRVDEHNNETKISIDALRLDLATIAVSVSEKLQEIENGQKVMFSTADDVLFIKKRLQYGIGEITSDVGNLLKIHGEMNNTLNNKIDKISNNVDNQSKSVQNLINATDADLKQVWRQMEVLFPIMLSNTQTQKDQFDQRNENFVKSTNSAMGGITSKVVDIQERIIKVEQHLNYLLQQRSLMTNQFNDIKSGFGKVLSDIKASLKGVQDKAQDLTHPGRHAIPPDYQSSEDEHNNPEKNETFGDIDRH